MAFVFLYVIEFNFVLTKILFYNRLNDGGISENFDFFLTVLCLWTLKQISRKQAKLDVIKNGQNFEIDLAERIVNIPDQKRILVSIEKQMKMKAFHQSISDELKRIQQQNFLAHILTILSPVYKRELKHLKKIIESELNEKTISIDNNLELLAMTNLLKTGQGLILVAQLYEGKNHKYEKIAKFMENVFSLSILNNILGQTL